MQAADLRRALLALVALLLGAAPLPAAAHLTPNSELRLSFEPGAMRVAVLIPAGEYAFATDRPADNRPESLSAATAYLLAHAGVAAPDGRRWNETVERIAVVAAPGGPDLVATVRFTPPPGAPDRLLTLEWDAVIAQSPDHFALVAVEGDLAAGLAEEHDLIGTFGKTARLMRIDRGETGAGGLFAGALTLGARHIVAGLDHLLFLLALLLPAPLVAAGLRWDGARPPAESIRALALIVTAFTVGHSGTLIAAAQFDARLPVAPVEALIALSVLVSAAHAMRPLFAGREPLVALVFGLVHGLAFATVVTGFGTSAAARAAAILGFNLGIELVQLAIVALLMPGLLAGARSRVYRPVRIALAGLIALAATVWLIERVSGLSVAPAAWLEAVLPPLGLLLIAASLGTGLTALLRRRRSALPVAAAPRRA